MTRGVPASAPGAEPEPAARPPVRRWHRAVAGCLTPAVLVVVALVQLVLTHTQDLTPWKGGGFGMFASVDRGEHRAVRVFLGTPDGQVPALLGPREDLSEGLGGTVARARNLPGPGAVRALADDLAAREWVYEDRDGARVAVLGEQEAEVTELPVDDAAGEGGGSGGPGAAADRSGAAPVQVRSVRVEVWKLRFDREGVRIVPVQLADVTREVG